MPPFERVEIEGVRVAYRQQGIGRDIICLHAIGHGGGDFDGIVAPLARQCRVTVIDWPNHGWSDDDTRAPSVGRYAHVLALLLTALDLRRVVVIGNSIGGGAAIQYTQSNPENVRALVLANPAGLVTPSRRTKTATRAMQRFFAAGVARRWWFDAAFKGYYRLVLPKAGTQARRRAIIAARYEMAPTLEQAWSSFAEPASDLRAVAAALECPVLVTWAMRDRFVRYSLCREALEMIPLCTIEKFERRPLPLPRERRWLSNLRRAVPSQ